MGGSLPRPRHRRPQSQMSVWPMIAYTTSADRALTRRPPPMPTASSKRRTRPPSARMYRNQGSATEAKASAHPSVSRTCDVVFVGLSHSASCATCTAATRHPDAAKESTGKVTSLRISKRAGSAVCDAATQPFTIGNCGERGAWVGKARRHSPPVVRSRQRHPLAAVAGSPRRQHAVPSAGRAVQRVGHGSPEARPAVSG